MQAKELEYLRAGLAALGLELPEESEQSLLAYRDLLVKWNKAFNLTAVRDPREMIGRHLIDSLSAWRHFQGERVLDMGTGAGLPGIPVAIWQPRWRVHLLDSNGKKTRFCTQAVRELGLSNVDVYQGRAEAHGGTGYDTVCSRAFASLEQVWALTRPLLGPGGRMVALRGLVDTSERRWLDGMDCRWSLHELGSMDAKQHRNVLVIQT